MDFSKLFPNLKKISEKDLKDKEKSLSVGDHVSVVKNIRCRQAGKSGVITKINPEDKHGWKSFVVKFDDSKYGSMAFQSGDLNKTVKTAGDYGTKRSLKGLLKFASLVKVADPPHRGLNDDNPLVRHLYQKFGWLAQNPDWYFKNFSTPKEYSDQSAEMYRWEQSQPRDMKTGRMTDETNAAMWDARRKRGGVSNSWFHGHTPPYPDDTPIAPKSHIILGSYPGGSVDVLNHENGHANDYLNSASVKEFNERDEMQKELAAWDNAGYKPGDPTREVALDTYRLGEKIRSLPEIFQDGSAIDYFKQKALDRLLNESAKNYQRVDNKYLAEHPASVPVIYDYRSALNALKNPDLKQDVGSSFYYTLFDPEFFDNNGAMSWDDVLRAYPDVFSEFEDEDWEYLHPKQKVPQMLFK